MRRESVFRVVCVIVVEAIQAHRSQGSEANRVIERFNRLKVEERQDIINFLRSLSLLMDLTRSMEESRMTTVIRDFSSVAAPYFAVRRPIEELGRRNLTYSQSIRSSGPC